MLYALDYFSKSLVIRHFQESLTAVKDTNTEKPETLPLCTAAISLSGSYCNLETKSSRNLPQKSAEVSRIVYVQIDPVATLGATQVSILFLFFFIVNRC